MTVDRQAVYDQLDPLLAKFSTDYHVPGLVFGVVADGRLSCVKTMGISNTGSGDLVTADSVFRIASMTKMVTALALLQLRDRRVLQFDELVEDIVPELNSLRYPTRDSRHLRVRDLLCHASGFVTDDPWGDRQLDMSENQFSAFLAAGFPFARAPGIGHEYSNVGYAILGRVIANKIRQPYDAYITEHILAPLGMASTNWEIRDIPADRRAIGYSLITGEWVEEPAIGHGAFGAMGGLHTTANDYAKFVAWLLSAWPPRDDPDGPILARSSIRELAQGDGFPVVWPRTNRSDPDQSDMARRYGLGIITVADDALGPCLTHSGGLPGYGSNVLLLPERGLGLFLFANVTYPHPGTSATVREAALALDRSQMFLPRRHEPLPELRDANDAVRRIYSARDIQAGGDVLAMNFLLDRDADRWKNQLEELYGALGACSGDGNLVTDSAMSGIITYPCERGRLQARVLLAPTRPAKIQKLEFSVLPAT